MNKSENKYFYTASLMNQALLELLEKKDIDFITITEITKKAGVNRGTFYLHYDNIYELLEETITNLNKEFLSTFSTSLKVDVNLKNKVFFVTEEFLIPYLNFCKRNKRVLKLVNQKPQLFQKEKAYKEMYVNILYPAISQFIKDENEKIFYLEFFTQGMVGIIRKWIELDCVTQIDELINIIKKCVCYDN